MEGYHAGRWTKVNVESATKKVRRLMPEYSGSPRLVARAMQILTGHIYRVVEL